MGSGKKDARGACVIAWAVAVRATFVVGEPTQDEDIFLELREWLEDRR